MLTQAPGPPEQVNSAIAAGQYWRLITPAFLHANVMHLAINCYSLNNIGPAAEMWCGPRRFAAVYGISAVAGTVASYVATPNPSVGASGALRIHSLCPKWLQTILVCNVRFESHCVVHNILAAMPVFPMCDIAAGAIFGIIGALAVFLQRNRDIFGARGDRVVRSLGQSVLLNVAFGALTPNVDNWCAHART